MVVVVVAEKCVSRELVFGLVVVVLIFDIERSVGSIVIVEGIKWRTLMRILLTIAMRATMVRALTAKLIKPEIGLKWKHEVGESRILELVWIVNWRNEVRLIQVWSVRCVRHRRIIIVVVVIDWLLIPVWSRAEPSEALWLILVIVRHHSAY